MFWKRLYENDGIAGVEREAVRFMQSLLPNVTVPKPTYTHFYYTPGIHANQIAGSYAKGLTDAHVLEWATKKPLEDKPECSLVLSTDTWNPRMVGWAMAGWQIVRDYFLHCEGVEIDSTLDYCKPYTEPPLSRTWCDCRPGTLIPPEGLAYIAQNCPRTSRTEQGESMSPPSWATFEGIQSY